MASQSFNLIGQEEEQELVAFETRQSRGPTPQSRPNSRMEEMLSQLIKSQEAMAKSLENRLVEDETKISDLEALSPVERIGVAPGVSTGLPPQKYHILKKDFENMKSQNFRFSTFSKSKSLNSNLLESLLFCNVHYSSVGLWDIFFMYFLVVCFLSSVLCETVHYLKTLRT